MRVMGVLRVGNAQALQCFQELMANGAEGLQTIEGEDMQRGNITLKKFY